MRMNSRISWFRQDSPLRGDDGLEVNNVLGVNDGWGANEECLGRRSPAIISPEGRRR